MCAASLASPPSSMATRKAPRCFDSHLHGGTLGGGVTTYGKGTREASSSSATTSMTSASLTQDSHGVVVQATSRNIVIRGNDIHDTSGDAVQCLNPDSGAQTPAEGVVIEKNRLYSTGENAVDIKTCRNVMVRENRMSDFHKSATSSGEAVVVHMSAQKRRHREQRHLQGRQGNRRGRSDPREPTPPMWS